MSGQPKTTVQQQVDQLVAKLNEHAQVIENSILRDQQQQQTIDQYRVNIFNIELKSDLLIKMLEEKGIMAHEELAKRWPLYLKNDVGVLEPDGRMSGELKVTKYGEK